MMNVLVDFVDGDSYSDGTIVSSNGEAELLKWFRENLRGVGKC